MMYFARRHEVHSIQTHTFCTTLVNKNRTFYNNVGGWNHQCQAKFLTSRHVRTHRATFYISNTLRKLMIMAWGLVF